MESNPNPNPPSFSELARPTLTAARVSLMSGFVQHGDTSTLAHTVSVAETSLAFVRAHKLQCDEASLVRGALLHDYYLYDWHDGAAAPDRWHAFTHPYHALRNAERDFDLTATERDIIVHHMFPLVPFPPRSLEALIVSAVDKVCTVREVIRAHRIPSPAEGGAQ